ncbi:unnamed protein product [Rotaria magnacalcarata]
MSVTLTKTSKNTPLLIHNSYSYTIDRKTVTKILWKCEYSRKYSCHGRLHTTSNYEFIKIVGEHENHVGNSRCAATRKYFEKLKQESEQNHTNPHNILTQVNIGVPDEVRVQLPTNYNLKRNVRRWRQVTTTEPTPTTIDFPAIPTKYHQTTRNTIFFRKDTGSAPAWQPQRVMMDFEKATINVFKRTLRKVELSGCYFHFSQSVLRFLQANGFKETYENDVVFADNIHKTLALAFIEPTIVANAFELLCTNLDDNYQQILDYIEDNYIERRRGRTRRQAPYPIDFWNMMERVKNNMHRTNNNIEGWHRKLNSAFQCSHPTLWSFLDKLMKEENNIHLYILNATTGRQPPVGKYESFNKRVRQLVDNPHPNIYDQLTCIGRLLSL